ncbi:MAG: NDP-sugar synthase [Acidobacteriota bacterium]
MILAAGLGTRLRPLTNDRPKALVEVAGRTLLEITLQRLRSAGVHEVIVNAHHFADQVQDYVARLSGLGMRIEISREEELLDTGGGLKRAAWFFLENNSNEPFLLHNVDVLSTIDVGAMMRFHRDRGALATLAVQDRATSRYLLFDQDGLLCGRRPGRDGAAEMARAADGVQPLAFAGIHVISPRIFDRLDESGAFSIIDCYLRLAAQGEPITAFRADGFYWRDLGKAESLAAAERETKLWRGVQLRP